MFSKETDLKVNIRSDMMENKNSREHVYGLKSKSSKPRRATSHDQNTYGHASRSRCSRKLWLKANWLSKSPTLDLQYSRLNGKKLHTHVGACQVIC